MQKLSHDLPRCRNCAFAKKLTSFLTLYICSDWTYRFLCRSKGLKCPYMVAVIPDINISLENLEPVMCIKRRLLAEKCLLQIQWWGKSSPSFPVLSVHVFQMTTKVTINWCWVTHNERLQEPQWDPKTPTTDMLIHTLWLGGIVWH